MGTKKKRNSNDNLETKPSVEPSSNRNEVKRKSRRFIGRSKHSKRGVVYVSSLPHGFYEKQLEGYFGQFGRVTGVYVPKSKKTGRSKGFAFVQFQHSEVAQIAAETMNNYLMFNRLIKTELISPDKHRSYMFKPKFKQMKHAYHEDRIKKKIKKQKRIIAKQSKIGVARKAAKKISKIQEMLQSHGLEYKVKIAGLENDVELTAMTKIDPENHTQTPVTQTVETKSVINKSKRKSKKDGDSEHPPSTSVKEKSMQVSSEDKSQSTKQTSKSIVKRKEVKKQKSSKVNNVSSSQQVENKHKTRNKRVKLETSV